MKLDPRLRAKLPIKEVANGLLSGGVFVGSAVGLGLSLPLSAALGGATWLGFRLFAGTDPTLAELLPDIRAGVDPEAAMRMIDMAQQRIEAMRRANGAIPDRQLTAQMDGIVEHASRIVARLEQNPAQVKDFANFIGPYLNHATEIATRYAELDQRGDAGPLRARFTELLDKISEGLVAQESKLAEGEQMELDVEMEVLEARMKREGLL
ncbi:MAG: hypothetical protein Alpg2KO_16240 [Alphaproteobacteria bacterium]